MISQLAISLDIYLDNGTYTAKQSDAGSRYLLISITDNGTATEIESNAVVNLKARKPSGAVSYDHGTVTDGKALILLTSDTLAEAGMVYCELEITQIDPVALLKTLTFKLDVKSEVYSQTIPESTSTFTALTEALAAAGSIGKVSDLKTEDKSTLVAGVNEIHDEVVDLQNDKEDKSNKVTSIDSESTDTQYPSAKLTYDQLALKEPNLPATPETPAEKYLNGNREWATPAHNKITDLNTDENYQHITTTQVTKLTNIEENAEVNIIETVSIDGADITPDANRNIDIPLATSTNDGAMSSEYAGKLDGIAENANNYTHPASHSPSIITQDANNRFVTDIEKSTWNGKQDALGFTPVPNTRKVNDKALSSDITLTQDDVGDGTTNKVFTSTEKSKLSGIAENANLYVHPNHTGDVTSDGDGAQTIANDAVTNAKLANMTRGTIKVGGASDAPTDLNAKTSGNILIGDGTDLKSVAVSGDITITNAGVTAIGNNKVTNAKLAQMNTKTIKGNDTAGTANAKDLTVAETKVLLDIDDLEAQVNSVPVSGTSKALTKSLSNTSAGITQALTVKGLTVTNLITNGNFANGTAGWTIFFGSSNIANSIFAITASGAAAECGLGSINKKLITGHKSYIRARARVTNSSCNKLRFRFYAGALGFVDINNPVINQWYECNHIVTGNSTTEATALQMLYIVSQYTDGATATGKILEVDGNYGISVINLTDTFGAGNEPDLATCQSKFPSYFDGTKSTDKGEVTVGEGTAITRARYPKLQSVPAITDTFDVLNGLHTQNVQDVAISSGTAVNTTNYPLAKNEVGFVIALDAGGTQTGTVGTDSASGNGTLYYQLATPVLSYYPPKSIPLEVNSSIVHQSIMSDIVFYSTGVSISDTDYPINSLQEVFKVDEETGVETPIDIATCTVASGGLSFTSTALTDGDLVWFRYEHTLDSTVPTTDYTYTTSLAGGLTTIQQDVKKQNESLQKQIDELRAIIASMAV